MDSQPRGFPRVALEAVANPSSSAYIHADTPPKPVQHAQCARGVKVQEPVEWQACMIQGRMSTGT